MALAQGYINPPQWATGYVPVQSGSTVTTKLINNRTPPTNLNAIAIGAITTWNIILPNPPYDGQIVSVACPGGAVGTVSISSTDGSTIGTISTTNCTQGATYATLQFNQPANNWNVLFSGILGSPASIIGNNTAPITVPGANLTVQNSATTAASIYATTGYSGTSPTGVYSGVSSTINVPASSTLIVNTAYGASYIDNAVFGAGQGVSAVGYSFNGIVNVPGAHGWSMVLALNDNTSGACNSAVNFCLLDGLELDFTSSSATANGTHVQGISTILTGNAAVIGNAVEVTSRSISQWNSAFITDDAAVSVAGVNIGAQNAQAANDPSQPFFMRGYDASNAAFSFELQTLNHVLNFTDTTRADGISITAANGGNPTVGATGTDTNININLTPKGNGVVQTAANLVAQNGTATPAGGTTGAGICVGSANVCIYWGSGAPTAAATQGSLYLRTDGSSTSTRLYVNTNGSTTWTNFTSAL